MLFDCCLTIVVIWKHRSNKQEKKGSLLPSARPPRSNIYANSHANPDFFQSDVHALARVQGGAWLWPVLLRAASHGFSVVFFLSLVLSSSGSCAFFRASKFVASPQFDRVHLKTLTIFFKAPEKSDHLHTQATQALLILCTVMRKLQVSSTRPPLQQQYTRFILKRNL